MPYAAASAAEHGGGENQLLLVVFGILVSIPIIVWGSTIVLKLMGRFPFIVTFGAGLLGYLAAGMIATDVAVAPLLAARLPSLEVVVPGLGMSLNIPGLFGAAAVIAAGTWLAKRGARRKS